MTESWSRDDRSAAWSARPSRQALTRDRAIAPRHSRGTPSRPRHRGERNTRRTIVEGTNRHGDRCGKKVDSGNRKTPSSAIFHRRPGQRMLLRMFHRRSTDLATKSEGCAGSDSRAGSDRPGSGYHVAQEDPRATFTAAPLQPRWARRPLDGKSGGGRGWEAWALVLRGPCPGPDWRALQRHSATQNRPPGGPLAAQVRWPHLRLAPQRKIAAKWPVSEDSVEMHEPME